ncbi:MAG TPA: ABC transporter ATP-binding protein [Acetobacteraceae bacterium]|jgi:branched-chain amino acid transport system ATP-binding protein|nr:ABC transporter ATP-binding protein [Acetobacteraceae bacterium]
MPEALLTARGIVAGYPGKQILFGVDLEVREGEVVALLGANGSGKSTLLNTISGFVRPSGGSVRLAGIELAGAPPHRIFRHGIVQVSQARDLFPEMTVEENLRLGAVVRKGPREALEVEVLARFPRLAEKCHRPVALLSGGEQQMVAIGRALMARPRLMLLDEPSGGLAPLLVQEIAAIMKALKARGTTMVIVEQNIALALAVADRFLILRDGRVVERHDVGAAAGSATPVEEIVRAIYL